MANNTSGSAGAGQATYTVQPGDSLYTIAHKHGMALNDLIAANPQISNTNLIMPGQTINIPGQVNQGQENNQNNNGQDQGQVNDQDEGMQDEGVQEGVTLRVSAAISLQNALEELRRIYMQQNPNVNIINRFGASGTLAREIEEGTPADIFFSAGEPQMDELARQKLIVPASRENVLGNELVLIAPQNSRLRSFQGLTDPSIDRIGIGTPQIVPAGMYAKETLTSLRLWDKVSPKLVYLPNVRSVLSSVESGDVDAGFVYRSDVVVSNGIKTVDVAPVGSHSPILYPIAIIRDSDNIEEAGEYVDFLSTDEASTEVFTNYGFTVLNSAQ